MESRILGIPLILILLVLAIALLVNVPMILLHKVNQEQFERVYNGQLNHMLQLQRVQMQLVATPSATPTVEPTPTQRPIQRTVPTRVPTITQQP